ncbi:MAG: hypothetical protein OXU74_06545 [Gemmatimonadota bacterium]|nr:hypothetical protein [Gemmatimonadota bacterium]
MAQTTITPRPAEVAAVAALTPERRTEYRTALLAPCPLDGRRGHIWTADRGDPRRWRCAGCTVRPFVADDPARRVAEALAALEAVEAVQ